MAPPRRLPDPVRPGLPLTALAPMQDVTDLDFFRTVTARGAPDFFFTEYFRVHPQSRLEPRILSSILENDTGRPVFAQVLGENLPDLGRTVAELQRLPCAGIDLNLGCPAPKIYRKNVGGGLLRDPAAVDRIVGFLRERVTGLFSVKMRVGFDSTALFDDLLGAVARHKPDLFSLHARTVKELYGPVVHEDCHRRAALAMPCPVLANGEIHSAARAADVLDTCGVAGVMVGRHAIRNPWIFAQIRRRLEGEPPLVVTLRDVRDYVHELWERTKRPAVSERAHVARMKKYLNFIGTGVDPAGAFLHAARRAESRAELFAACQRYLDSDEPYPEVPYPGLVARPNREELAHACR